MKYRQSLIQYSLKYGVSRASRKYKRTRSYIYFWRKRYDGTPGSLACHSRRPHHHPQRHTPEELILINNMRRRNPRLGLVEFWCRLRARGYTRRIESLYRTMKRMGLATPDKPCVRYVPKPYQAMKAPGERIQIDGKQVPTKCRVSAAETAVSVK